MMEFIKEKSYYLLGGTVILIILIIVLSSCSKGSSSYESIENNMIKAASKYYANRKSSLPKLEGDSVEVSLSTLIESELIKEVKDPKNKNNTCSGHVTVTKVGDEYDFAPYLFCEGNYEPEYLTDIVKETVLDEYGNGVYEIGDSYIYRGSDVTNYVSFNDETWRIISTSSDGITKMVKIKGKTDQPIIYDSRYNSVEKSDEGVTDDFLNTNVRKSLANYYKALPSNIKAYLSKTDLCVGSLAENTHSSSENECAILEKDMYVGLLTVSDYETASLDSQCLSYDMKECSNLNYLTNEKIKTWLLTKNAENNYEVYFLNKYVTIKKASSYRYMMPVLYLKKNTIISKGTGTIEDPYIVK